MFIDREKIFDIPRPEWPRILEDINQALMRDQLPPGLRLRLDRERPTIEVVTPFGIVRIVMQRYLPFRANGRRAPIAIGDVLAILAAPARNQQLQPE